MRNALPDISEISPTDRAQAEALVEDLCLRVAMTTGKASHLNVISLLTSGLMTWGPENKAPLTYDQARDEAAALVLEAVTGVMVAITEL
jgi:hypothetical protein